MATLIEIGCPVPKEEVVRATIAAFCKETGALLIGRCVYEEINEVLLIVRLLDATGVSNQVTVLGQALQQEVITLFQCVTCELMKISFDPSLDLREQMRDFPLRPGESWFPAIHDSQQAYVCMSRPAMVAEQAAWLLGHEVVCAFM